MKKNITRFFTILGILATLYPLIIKLEALRILEKNLPSKEYKEYTFLTSLN